MPGGPEWIIVLVIALLIFGKNLPEVGRSMGKTIIEFKKGLKGMEAEVHKAERDADEQANRELPKSQDKAKLS